MSAVVHAGPHAPLPGARIRRLNMLGTICLLAMFFAIGLFLGFSLSIIGSTSLSVSIAILAVISFVGYGYCRLGIFWELYTEYKRLREEALE